MEFLMPPKEEEIKACMCTSVAEIRGVQPVILELGPGTTPYTLNAARLDPTRLFVAIDRLSPDELLWEWQNGPAIHIPRSIPSNFLFALQELSSQVPKYAFWQRVETFYCFFPDLDARFAGIIAQCIRHILAVSPQSKFFIATERYTPDSFLGQTSLDFRHNLMDSLRELQLRTSPITLPDYETQFRQTETTLVLARIEEFIGIDIIHN